MTTFAVHGWEGVDPALEFGPLAAEFKRRGFPFLTVRTKRSESVTPHQDCAAAIVESLREVKDDVAMLGVSNQGLFLPLVAAARPVMIRLFVLSGSSGWPARSSHSLKQFTSWLTFLVLNTQVRNRRETLVEMVEAYVRV